MVVRLKLCAGCQQDMPIWKSDGREKYCRRCWEARSPEKSPPVFKPVKKRSGKKETEDREYKALRDRFLSDHPHCQMRLPGCTGFSYDVHHTKGRGQYYLVVSTWLAGCRHCHDWLTENSSDAIEMGLSQSRNKTAA